MKTWAFRPLWIRLALASTPTCLRGWRSYVWDEVLEYRVWCQPEQGAPNVCDGSDYFYAFSSHAEAWAFAAEAAGAQAPLALVLQREYIDEPEDGRIVHLQQERITEMPPHGHPSDTRPVGQK